MKMLSESILNLPNKKKNKQKQKLDSTILDVLQSCLSPHKLPKSINKFLKLNAQTHSYNIYRDSDALHHPLSYCIINSLIYICI